MWFSVIVPAFNEGIRISTTLESVIAYFQSRAETFEVLVVDDGSTDDTRRLASEIANRDPRVHIIALGENLGKGAAVRAGVLASRGRRVLFTDADLSSPLTELPKLEQAMATGISIAIGSRGLSGSSLVQRQPRVREWAGKAGNRFIRLLCPGLRGISDTQCGFKLFDGEAARSLFAIQSLNRYGFDVEVLFLAHRSGHAIAEVPVEWAHGEGSKVRSRDYLHTLAEVVRIRINDLTSRYSR